MNLLAKPPFRPDAEGVANDQHPDHQFGIYRWPTCRAVERREMVAHISEIEETVDAPEQMIRRDMVFYRELVEQRALRNLLRPHHRQFSHAAGEVNQQPSHHSSGVFQHHLCILPVRANRSIQRNGLGGADRCAPRERQFSGSEPGGAKSGYCAMSQSRWQARASASCALRPSRD